MKCPKCENLMEDGEVRSDSTILGLIFIGLSYQKMIFSPYLDNIEKDNFQIMTSNQNKTGHHCRSCKLTLIES